MRWQVFGSVAVWGVAAAAVWFSMVSYGTGAAGQPDASGENASWPDVPGITLAPDRATVVYCIHPRCPCTRASTRQLSRVLHLPSVSADELPALVVLISVPAKHSAEFRQTDIVAAAAELPGARLVYDEGGLWTSQLGASNSGAVIVFDPQGNRLFHGGLTASRGHEGASSGMSRLQQVLFESPSAHNSQEGTPVFGCRLCLPDPADG